MNFTLVTRMLVFFILIIIISLANYALLEKIYKDTKEQHNLVKHTYEVINKKNNLLSLLVDMETGQRGFIATNDKLYLEPYNKALSIYKVEFNKIKNLTNDNILQQERLDNIYLLISKKITELNSTIYYSLHNEHSKAIKLIKSNFGKSIMDSIRYQLNSFEKEEQRLLKHREDKFNDSLFYMRFVFLSITILLILVSIFFGILVHKHLVVPIIKLDDIMSKTKDSGKLPKNNIDSNDIKITEIKNLTKSFFSMANKIETFTTELNISKNEAIQKSITDPLTSLYNREYMDIQLTKLISKAKRDNSNLALMLIDIDFFKKVNDTYGHLVGDIVLKKIANILKINIRDTDMTVRYGGEEFIIILPDTNKINAINLANKLTNTISKIIFKDLENNNITISIGVSTYIENDTIDSLIKRADDGLYQAKNTGRDKVVFFDKKTNN